jgi:pilus assembly protein CpaE
MLRAIVICPDAEVNGRLDTILSEIGIVTITRVMDRYPNALELLRFLRAHAPQVVFLSTESMIKAGEVVREIEKHAPGVQIIAVGHNCDQQLLLELMRAGIREYAPYPFERTALAEALLRIREMLDSKPALIDATDMVFSFLPSKAGVGASTIALNASVALSRLPNSNVLLSDFDLNSGMMRFMLKLDNSYCVTDAAEHSLHMDEALWPQMVTTIDKLDVLHAGKLNPDFRIESSQINHLMEFMRRNYGVLCFDLSGNLEKYSLEIMHESKKIFMVCTPEIPSLHLAREKYLYLKQLDLQDRVCILLNRCQKRPLISPEQVEQLLGVPVTMTFPNDYQGVHRSLTFGRWVEPATELGKQFTLLSQVMLDNRPLTAADSRKKFIEFFSVIPGKLATISEAKKPAV